MEIAAREKRAAVPWCDLFALLCNLLAGGKRTWKREDFMGSDDKPAAPPSEIEAGLRAYQESVAASRARAKKKGGP